MSRDSGWSVLGQGDLQLQFLKVCLLCSCWWQLYNSDRFLQLKQEIYLKPKTKKQTNKNSSYVKTLFLEYTAAWDHRRNIAYFQIKKQEWLHSSTTGLVSLDFMGTIYTDK